MEFSRGNYTWEMVTHEECRYVQCSAPTIMWGQNYPLHFSPKDIYQAEMTLINVHLNLMLPCNEDSVKFLKALYKWLLSKAH